MTKFTAAIIQTTTPNDVTAAFAELAGLVRAAAGAGAKFIATPEGSNLLERDREKFRQICPKLDDGYADYAALARELGIYLSIGSALLQQAGKKAVNRSLLFTPNGDLIAHYDKIHLFDVNLGAGQEMRESDAYEAGERAVIAATELGKIGLSICYDVRFAALYRALAQKGAEILLIPAAFTAPTGKAHWEVLLRARAIENGAYVIAAAQAGTHLDGRKTFGNSMIINPWGEIIARLDGENTSFALAEIDLGQVKTARQKIPAWGLNKSFDFND